MRWRHSNAWGGGVLFVATMATAVALAPGLAHLFELANKIDLPRDSYFTVQTIYRGWDRFGYVIGLQFVSILAALILFRYQSKVFALTALALVGVVSAQLIFWVLTYPVNVATGNWTMPGDEWTALRSQWEYSHAAGALCQAIALAALVSACLIAES